MYTLKFSIQYKEDTKSSIRYIKLVLQNPTAAQRLKTEIENTYAKIKQNPLIFPKVPVEHLAEKGYRFVLIRNYMLFFKVKDKVINIDRFLYGPRDWINILENE